MTQQEKLKWKELAFVDALVNFDSLDQSDFVSHKIFAPKILLNCREGFFLQTLSNCCLGCLKNVNTRNLEDKYPSDQKITSYDVFGKEE